MGIYVVIQFLWRLQENKDEDSNNLLIEMR